MKATEQDMLLRILQRRGSPVRWATEFRQNPENLVSRLYILSSELQVCITVYYGEASWFMIDDLTPQGQQGVSWLSRYTGKNRLEPQRAKRIFDRLATFSLTTRADCITNSRDGILFYHVMVTATEEHCFKMQNPHYHDDTGYQEIVDFYSSEFLGGINL